MLIFFFYKFIVLKILAPIKFMFVCIQWNMPYYFRVKNPLFCCLLLGTESFDLKGLAVMTLKNIKYLL